MNIPTDKQLYEEAKSFIMSKYKTNSPFASGAVVKHYKQLFKKRYGAKNPYYGKKDNENLNRWFGEKWVSVNPIVGNEDNDAYAVFRPTVKVNSKTPTLLQSIPKKSLIEAVKKKQTLGLDKRLGKFVVHHGSRVDGNHPAGSVSLANGIKGGKLSTSTFKNLLGASYDKNQKSIDGFNQDTGLSTNTSKVYYNPQTGQTVVAHKGTSGFTDWFNNAAYAVGGETLYKTTPRYKEAKRVQKDAEKKYGRENISTIGHSQGGLQAELLGKKGDEIITLNKATRPFSNTKQSNQTDVRTSGDYVSALNPFQPRSDITIRSPTYNPLTEHSVDVLDRLKPDRMIGGMLVRSFRNRKENKF